MKKGLILIPILLIMTFTLFNKKTKEEKFWKWFSDNQIEYYEGVENLDIRDELFDKLSVQLKKIHPDLVFEFSKIHENGIREFTISADGLKEIFPFVSKLVDNSPKIEKWQFNAFRQRVPGNEIGLNFGEFKISYDDIYFRYLENHKEELGIELNIRDYNDEGQRQNAIYVLLDALIGEYDVVKGIDWIDWVKLDEKQTDSLRPLIELRTLIDNRKIK